MSKLSSAILFFTVLIMGACSTEKKTGESHRHEVPRQGFASINELSKSVINSLIAENYNEYLSHVMTEADEKQQAELITDKKTRKDFLKEFGFSIKEEKVYFDNMLNAIKSDGLDLTKALLDEIEVFDYALNKYAPVNLKEVIIPIPLNDYEEDLVFVAIEINGKWYLTAELGI